MPIELVSPAFNDGDDIPVKYTKSGDNINPPLQFLEVPTDTVSLALIIDSNDNEDNFTHWMLWNIPSHISEINEDDTVDEAIEGYNDYTRQGYTGPNPLTDDEHEYHFKVYALDTELELDDDSTRDKLEKAMAGHILDEAVLTGIFTK